jgi:hypothetical protein
VTPRPWPDEGVIDVTSPGTYTINAELLTTTEQGNEVCRATASASAIVEACVR